MSQNDAQQHPMTGAEGVISEQYLSSMEHEPIHISLPFENIINTPHEGTSDIHSYQSINGSGNGNLNLNGPFDGNFEFKEDDGQAINYQYTNYDTLNNHFDPWNAHIRASSVASEASSAGLSPISAYSPAGSPYLLAQQLNNNSSPHSYASSLNLDDFQQVSLGPGYEDESNLYENSNLYAKDELPEPFYGIPGFQFPQALSQSHISLSESSEPQPSINIVPSTPKGLYVIQRSGYFAEEDDIDIAPPTIVVEQPSDASPAKDERIITYGTDYRRPRSHSDSTAVRGIKYTAQSRHYASQSDAQQDFLHPYATPPLSSSIQSSIPSSTIPPNATVNSSNLDDTVYSVGSPESSISPVSVTESNMSPVSSPKLSPKFGSGVDHLHRSSSLGGLERRSRLTDFKTNMNNARLAQSPANFVCLYPDCNKRFTRAYNLRSHMRTHTQERPFECSVCGQTFVRPHDKKRHEALHSGVKEYVCRGRLRDNSEWGCKRQFARQDALTRHFKSASGRECIRRIVEEEGGSVDDMKEGEATQWESFAARNAVESKKTF